MKEYDRYVKKGFTLIEVLISLCLLVIVFGGAFMLLGFGSNTFTRGTEQYDIQANIRIAEAYITNQVRFATDVKIIDVGDVPPAASLANNENYIYFDSSNHSITHIKKNFKRKFEMGEEGSLEFSSNEPYEELDFVIKAKEKRQNFSIEDKIDPLNIKYGVMKLIDGTAVGTIKSGQAIYFKTASEYLDENWVGR